MQLKINFKIPIMRNVRCRRDFDKDPEVVELSGAVVQSFYKDVPMFVFRVNGVEPTMSCVAFVTLLSLVAARIECMLIL